MLNKKVVKYLELGCGLALFLAVGAGCGASREPETQTQITLSKTTAKIDYFQTLTLEAFVTDSVTPVLWSSSNETIASVNGGKVTPTLNEGSVTITATADGVSASCVVEVVKSGVAPVLNVDYEEISLAVGEELTVTSNVYFQGERIDEELFYQVSLANGATEGIFETVTADNQVKFKALAVGDTVYEISTTIRDLTLIKQISASVVEEEVIFVSDTLECTQGGFMLELGLTETEDYETSGSVQLSAYKNGEQLTDFVPTWTKSESDAFSFDNGVVTALKEGNGTLTTEYEGETVTVYVNVVRPLIEQTQSLIMETVNTQLALPIPLNGQVTEAILQGNATQTQTAFEVSYTDGVLTYDSSVLPKLAEDLGARTLIIETDKAKYRFPVTVYTMVINTESELNSLIPTAKAMGNGTYWTGYFVLGEDIYCEGAYESQWDGVRVGADELSDSTGFNGIFDGCGYTIYNLKTTGVTGGLIPCLNAGGKIKNVSLINASNIGKGGLVSSLSCGSVENVYVSVSVKGEKGTRNRNYTSAFISDVISTARIQKVFVDILEKTGDTQYCNPFYVMHEGYGILNSFYAVGTELLWEKSQWEGTQGPAKDCGAYTDVVAMKQAGISTKSWENEFWSAYNGLPYPKSLGKPNVELTLKLSSMQALAGETLRIVELSKNTIVELDEDALSLGVELNANEVVLPKELQAGVIITLYARNVYNPAQYIEVKITLITENDLKDGEIDNEDVWN